MTTVAELLIQSRQEHADARAHKVAGRLAQASECLQTALAARLSAAEADPTFTDAEWLEDARMLPRPGVKGPQYHRVPGLSRAEVAAQRHAELLAYFAEQLAKA